MRGRVSLWGLRVAFKLVIYCIIRIDVAIALVLWPWRGPMLCQALIFRSWGNVVGAERDN